MAQITGSSTIDWSSISLAQVDFETHFVNFANRVDQIENAFGSGNYSPVFASPTLIVVDLGIGGRLSIGGSGFDGTSPLIINSATYKNPPNGTGEVLRFTGTLDGTGGNDVLTSVTIGSTGFSETFTGNIIVPVTFPDPPGNSTATLTSLVVKIGSATGTFSGTFTASNVAAGTAGGLRPYVVSTSRMETVRASSMIDGGTARSVCLPRRACVRSLGPTRRNVFSRPSTSWSGSTSHA